MDGEIKRCKGECGKEKELNEENFYKRGDKYKFRNVCKICENKKKAKYRKENREKIRECAGLYREKNKEEIRKRRQKHRENNKEEINRRRREYNRNNKERVNRQQREYYQKNREKILKTCKEYNQGKREQLNEWQREYRKKNKEMLREKEKKRGRERRKKRPWDHIWRNVLVSVLTRFKHKKSDKTVEILGYSAQELKEHLESRFQEGMSWDNYGRNGWVIDHVVPVSKFDKDTPMHIVNSLKNLQPLWEKDNLSKGNKII